MKLKKLPIWALALAILAGSGCSRDDYNYAKDDAYGTLSFALATDNLLNEGEISRAGERAGGQITISEALGGTNVFNASTFLSTNGGNFSIVVEDADEETIYSGPISGWSNDKPLAFGNYTVTATYDLRQVGFYGNGGQPAFESEEVSFAIANADIPTEVTIPVVLSNSIMRVQYSDMFKKYYSNCEVIVTQNNSSVTFNYDETRGAFFETGNATINYTLTPAQAQGDNSEVISKLISHTFAAKSCHTLQFNVTNVGGVNKLTITLDDTTIQEVEIGDIDLNDDQYQPNDGE